MPSAAQVWMPSCSYCSSSTASSGEDGGWRTISRRTTIRWRGVVVVVAARTHGLAEATLDALGRGGLDLRGGLEVAQVDARIAVEHHAGAEDEVGVGELLDPPHQVGGPGTPPARHVGGHVHAGAMLGLERAAPQRIPPELFAITPPMQAMSELAGSGPSRRP